jgi:hypothetical protein
MQRWLISALAWRLAATKWLAWHQYGGWLAQWLAKRRNKAAVKETGSSVK